MLIAVKDSCVLIDLVNGGLIGRWFQLRIETHTTDAVVYEIEDEVQHEAVSSFIEAGMIQVTAMYQGGGFEGMQVMANLAVEMGVSLPDASAFLLAEKLEAILLTGDGDLRKEATSRGVTVCGVLWVLDMLVWQDVIDFHTATDSLNAMRESGARLPSVECERRLKSWNANQKIRPRVI